MVRFRMCRCAAISDTKKTPVPAGIDYDIWTGPLPQMPFNRNRYHGTVNWHWHYGCGDLGNDGIHWVDIARWAMNVETPTSVSGMGRKLFFDDDQQTPDTQNITWDFDKRSISYEQRLWNTYRLEGSENSVAVYGTEGMAVAGRWEGGLHQFRRLRQAGETGPLRPRTEADQNTHARNFIDCIKSRKLPNADIETGHVSTVSAIWVTSCRAPDARIHTMRRRKPSRAIADANRLVKREYRAHWSTPKGA